MNHKQAMMLQIEKISKIMKITHYICLQFSEFDKPLDVAFSFDVQSEEKHV